MILTPLQKLPKNVRYLGKIIVAKGFKKWPKVQKIARSGHTGEDVKRKRGREWFYLKKVKHEWYPLLLLPDYNF